ncbi:MAG: GSCFA domain-containing protein [Rikenellaceae bacterium]
MKFRTEIDIPKAKQQLDYSNKILALGSCFALSIGGRLQDLKFNICVNPIGVLFNPLSICSTLQRLSSCRLIDIEELQQSRGEWFHFDFHSSLSDVSSQLALQRINNAIKCGAKAIEQCDTVIITLGTAWVYELLNSGRVVANCHKEPAKRFTRRALSIEEIVEALGAQVSNFPKKQFIFSLSPIRHLLDGLTENSLSKALLRVAIARVVEQYDNASYFPSYETLIDDLRDYRFYAEDMLHPSQQAIDYIWAKFQESYITSSAMETMEGVSKIIRAAAHRPFNVASSAHQTFCRKQLEQIKNYPMIDFGKESAYFMNQLQNNL